MAGGACHNLVLCGKFSSSRFVFIEGEKKQLFILFNRLLKYVLRQCVPSSLIAGTLTTAANRCDLKRVLCTSQHISILQDFSVPLQTCPRTLPRASYGPRSFDLGIFFHDNSERQATGNQTENRRRNTPCEAAICESESWADLRVLHPRKSHPSSCIQRESLEGSPSSLPVRNTAIGTSC